jgi:hypothetical protein
VLLLAGGWIGPDRQRADHDKLQSNSWHVGRPAAIAVHEGRAVVQVPTNGTRSEVLVVVSSLARARGPFPIRLTAVSESAADAPELADDGSDHARSPLEFIASAPLKPSSLIPPRERTFHMMVRDGDAASASNYTAINGVLKGVGRHVQVYVATEDREQVGSKLIEDLITSFDDRILPLACRQVGVARDVDGDGRFTILVSRWLDRLGGGRYPVDGFVRVADFDAAYRAPFGNACDMMYVNAGLEPGPHMRTVVAHEYMHAALFSQRAMRAKRNGQFCMEEEGWLDEALAHLAEDYNGFATSNIDYRMSAFLTSPESYPLVVDDYYAADLFRSHGSRGSTYLFLRWCADRYGADLVTRLVHSDLKGVPNLEAATGSTFPGLYRRWSLALYLSGLELHGAGHCEADGFRSVNVRAPCEGWELAGPRYERVCPDSAGTEWQALGTSSHFTVVTGSPKGAVRIEIVGPKEADLQVTVVPLPDDLPRLDLSVSRIQGPGGELRLRARVRETNGAPVRLSALSWEPLTPSPNPHAPGFRCGRLDMLGIASTFGTSALSAGGELSSDFIPLPGVSTESGPLVIKVIGTDPKGRRVAAWADVAKRDSAASADH